MTEKPFPLKGVIGVVSTAANELEQAQSFNLQCVELRADLLIDAGFSIEQLHSLVVRTAESGLACLFTLRHKSQGGTYSGTESERVNICRSALAHGADIIDLEWGFSSAETMLAEGAPVVLSYHNFEGMLDDADLASLTQSMSALNPAAIKVIPTATTLADSAKMLEWAGGAQSGIRRIGFAMGGSGECSRILTIAHAAPVTYASFGQPVAPGQIAIDFLLNIYRAHERNNGTRVVAHVQSNSNETCRLLNAELHANGKKSVVIPFLADDVKDIMHCAETLRVDWLIVEDDCKSAIAEQVAGIENIAGDVMIPLAGNARGLPGEVQPMHQALFIELAQ